MKLEGRDAADFLFGSLDGAARDEVRLRSRDEWETPEQLFAVLRETFGEKLTAKQLLQRFYGRRQGKRESIQDFSHSLIVLMDKIQKCHPGTFANPDKDRTLRDTFVENLRDQQLRRDLKRMIRESPDRRFQAVREEALRSAEEDRPPPRIAYSGEVEAESAECQQVTAPQSKLIQELLASQKVLTEGLQRQQQVLADTQASLATLANRVQGREARWSALTCYTCGRVGHISRFCTSQQDQATPRNQTTGRNSGRKRQERKKEDESSNSNALQQ
ncbi:predicted protein [Nematostella vectensis]|uniref:CCHC-type domain-containing protein n=1 Tax=Nematostella vectensis TaxID=45351 RepID=A7SSS3_NEMVE|nr:predicted protein [Nematostella vectensis]|eukprot:XP_001625328.1 predicted protein [Nematostella vectensis]